MNDYIKISNNRIIPREHFNEAVQTYVKKITTPLKNLNWTDSVLDFMTEDRNDDLEGADLIKEWPINKAIQPNLKKLVKAIRYGMVIMIEYKGAEDDHPSGHERVIYPMVLGKSKDGKYLLRGYHFTGWSMSERSVTDKVWRMFRGDRIKNMTFTGSFYKLAPDGYNKNDSGMATIVVKADINNIIRNQEKIKGNADLEFDDEANPSASPKQSISELTVEQVVEENIGGVLLDEQTIGTLDTIHIYKAVFEDEHIALINLTEVPNIVVIKKEAESAKGRYKLISEVSFDELMDTKINTNDIYRVKTKKEA
jgi:hypothetical protein